MQIYLKMCLFRMLCKNYIKVKYVVCVREREVEGERTKRVRDLHWLCVMNYKFSWLVTSWWTSWPIDLITISLLKLNWSPSQSQTGDVLERSIVPAYSDNTSVTLVILHVFECIYLIFLRTEFICRPWNYQFYKLPLNFKRHWP